MPHTDEAGELKPLLQPRLVRAVKNRPRLVDMGVRREILDELEQNIASRRTADTVASRLSHSMTNAVKESTEPVVRNKVKGRLDSANEGALKEI